MAIEAGNGNGSDPSKYALEFVDTRLSDLKRTIKNLAGTRIPDDRERFEAELLRWEEAINQYNSGDPIDLIYLVVEEAWKLRGTEETEGIKLKNSALGLIPKHSNGHK